MRNKERATPNKARERRGQRRIENEPCMNLWSAISIGLKEIWAHKFRSLLTMLGIILGASSLIAMSALVKGREVAAKEALIATGGLQKIRIEPQEVPIQQWHLKDQAVGVTINSNGQPFTIVGLFEHYESEQERKERELAKLQPKQAATGPKRSRGWSGRGGRGAFRMKNNTLFMPLNTVWLKFRAAGAGGSGGGGKSASATAGTVNVPDPRLSGLEGK